MTDIWYQRLGDSNRANTTVCDAAWRATDTTSYVRERVDLQSTGPVKLIQKALTADPHTLTLVSLGVLAYGALWVCCPIEPVGVA